MTAYHVPGEQFGRMLRTAWERTGNNFPEVKGIFVSPPEVFDHLYNRSGTSYLGFWDGASRTMFLRGGSLPEVLAEGLHEVGHAASTRGDELEAELAELYCASALKGTRFGDSVHKAAMAHAHQITAAVHLGVDELRQLYALARGGASRLQLEDVCTRATHSLRTL